MICFYKGNFLHCLCCQVCFCILHFKAVSFSSSSSSSCFFSPLSSFSSPFFFTSFFVSSSSSLSVDIHVNIWGNMGHGGYAVHHLQNWEMKSSEPQVRCHAVFSVWVAIPVLQSGQFCRAGWHNFWNLKQSLKLYSLRIEFIFMLQDFIFYHFLYSLWFNRKF